MDRTKRLMRTIGDSSSTIVLARDLLFSKYCLHKSAWHIHPGSTPSNE